jgi:hypothetical protein
MQCHIIVIIILLIILVQQNSGLSTNSYNSNKNKFGCCTFLKSLFTGCQTCV